MYFTVETENIIFHATNILKNHAETTVINRDNDCKWRISEPKK